MTRTDMKDCLAPHKIQLLFGADVILAYEDGEDRTEVLSLLGEVRELNFDTVTETNAFLRGLEISHGREHVLAVDDLQVA